MEIGLLEEFETAELDCYPKFLLKNYKESPDKVAVIEKGYGIWNKYTWEQCYEIVKRYSLGFVSLGLAPEDKVVVIGDERPEAFWTLAAVQSNRGIPVPIWPDSNSDEVMYYVNHSEAKFIVCEDQEQIDKVLNIKGKIPLVKRVLYWDPRGLRSYDDPLLLSYGELVELGVRHEEEHPGSFEENLSRVTGDDIAAITYTSGATGLPKGCITSQKDLLYTVRGWRKRMPIGEDNKVASVLPPAHIFEQWTASPYYLEKSIMCFSEEPETMVSDLRQIGPKSLLLSPRQLLSFYSTCRVKIGDAPWLNRFMYALFLPVGYKVVNVAWKWERLSLFWQILYFFGDWIVLRPLRDKLGLGRTEYPFAGGGVSDPGIMTFFNALGIKMHQLYGLTETGLCTVHSPDDINPDTVGVPCVGRNIRVSDEGEILVSQRGGFSEYYKDPERTAEVVNNGWIRTGDAGFVTPEGHLVFVDRITNLATLRNGAKYAPAFIEEKLKFSSYIQEAVAIGDESTDYILMIVVIDYVSVGKWAEKRHIGYTTFADLSQKEEVSDLIRQDVDRVNRILPEESRIKKYVLLHKEFDADDAELTRSRKTRRAVIRERYADIIEAMCAGKQQVPLLAEVKYRDGRTATVSANLIIRSV